MYLLKQSTIECIKDPDKSPLGACRSKQLAVMCESKARNSRIMRHYEFGSLGCIMLYPNLPLLQPRANQHKRSGHLGHSTKPLRVGNSLDLMQQLQISKIVNENFLLQDDNNSISSKAHATNLRPKRQLPDTPALMVVPNHDLVDRIPWIRSTTDQSQNVATKEHFNDSDTTSMIEIPPKNLTKRIAIVDPKPLIRTGSKAAMILVEGHMEERRYGRWCGRESFVESRVSSGTLDERRAQGRRWVIRIRKFVGRVTVIVSVRLVAFGLGAGLLRHRSELVTEVRGEAQVRVRVRVKIRVRI